MNTFSQSLENPVAIPTAITDFLMTAGDVDDERLAPALLASHHIFSPP